MTEEVRVSWSRPRQAWAVRFWSKEDQAWIIDSYYPVKDVDPETDYGWVSEGLIIYLHDLQEMGYKVVFVA